MILTIDIGNSNIVLGGVEDTDIRFEARLRTDATKTSDEYAVDLKMLLDIYAVDPKAIEGIIIASVVPQVLNSLQTAVKILLESPGQMGADLVAGDVAALLEHEPPLIVVDMGTATTLSVLDKNGAHIGGCICPGVKISLDALTDKTALLPGLQLDKPRRAIGRNTSDAMRSGIMLGAAAMIDGLVERMEEELGYKTTVIMTGGIAKFVAPLCKTPVIYDRDLILKGLTALYRENRRS